jgi:tetratricopeptide (TPR) repeat protein
MEWYYIKQGCFDQRGVVSWEQLEKLVRTGEIQDSDLIYSEGTHNKWVRANSIQGLFSLKNRLGTAAKPATALPVSPVPKAIPEGKSSSQKKIPVWRWVFATALAGIVLLAITAVVIVASLKRPPVQLPVAVEPPLVAVEAPDPWLSVEGDVRGLLQSGQLLEAGSMLNRYIEDVGTNEISARLTRDLQYRQKVIGFGERYSVFRANRASEDDMLALVSLSSELGRLEALVHTLQAALVADPAATPATCRSILALGRILQNDALQMAAVEALSRSFDRASAADSLELARLYTAYQMPHKAIALLETFAEENPNTYETWLELAALLAVQEQTDAALAALRKAVQTGGDAARDKAREDVRFEAVRRTWSFRRQTR